MSVYPALVIIVVVAVIIQMDPYADPPKYWSMDGHAASTLINALVSAL